MEKNKICITCKLPKEIILFYRDKHTKDGRTGKCKSCFNIRVREWINSSGGREYITNYSLKYHYGITKEELAAMLEKQNDVCAICFKASKLCIDHCHSSGKFRGLLCQTCNKGIGLFKDNIEFLENAAKYLKEVNKHG